MDTSYHRLFETLPRFPFLHYLTPVLLLIGATTTYVLYLSSFIYIPLPGARRAMAAALPLPLAESGGFFYITFFLTPDQPAQS